MKFYNNVLPHFAGVLPLFRFEVNNHLHGIRSKLHGKIALCPFVNGK